MPFGFKKGEAGDADLDSKKASLFGKKSSKAAAPAASNNPYATQYVSDQYAPQSQTSLTQPPTSSFGSLSLNNGAGGAPPSYRSPSPQPNRYEKSPVPTGGYGGAGARYQASANYGQTSGYGDNPYGNGGPSRYGSGGYGGMGRTNSQETTDTTAGRNALFGDAATRAAQNKAAMQQQDNDSSYAAPGGYSSAEQSGGYGAMPDRELTAEEEEEEEVSAKKQEIKFVRDETIASLERSKRMGLEAMQNGDDTIARLYQQGDRIHNTERNLDSASNQNRLAEEKARELKTLNRSMFAVHVSNPFTAKKREEAANAIALEKHQRERNQRDDTASQAYTSKARQERYQREINSKLGGPSKSTGTLGQSSKYEFEADEEDLEQEAAIADGIDALGRITGGLKMRSDMINEEITSQNKHLERISKKTDKVDDQIALNRARLDRIR